MKKILFTSIFTCVFALIAHAQSVMITSSLTKTPNSSAMVQYNNFFGQWNMPDKDVPFPFAVIRIDLSGDEASIRAAKIRFGFDVGNMHRIESDIRTEPNQILLLVPYEVRNIYLTCGDGCEKQLLYSGRLQPNVVYCCKVEYTKEIAGNADAQLLQELEFLKQQIALINAEKNQEKIQQDSSRIKIEMAQEQLKLALMDDSLKKQNIDSLYNEANNLNLLVPGLTQEGFCKLVSSETGLKSFCDYATRKGVEDFVFEQLKTKVLIDPANAAMINSINSNNVTNEPASLYPMQMVKYSKSDRKWLGKPDFSCNGEPLSEDQLGPFLQKHCTKAYKKYVRSSGLRSGGWLFFIMGLAAGGTGAYFYFGDVEKDLNTGGTSQNVNWKLIGQSMIAGGAGLSFVIGLPMLSVGHYRANNIDKIYNKHCGNNPPPMTLNLQSSRDGIGLAFKF